MGCIQSQRPDVARLPNQAELQIENNAIINPRPEPDYAGEENRYSFDPTAGNSGTVDQSEPLSTYEELPDNLMKTIFMPTIELQLEDRKQLVIAIDFGTTYSAYAYAHIDKKNMDVMINKNWEAEGCAAQFKTPTCLCVAAADPTQIHSFGLEAQKYSSESEEDEGIKALNLKLFDRFKMELYAAKNVTRNMQISATGDSEFSMKALDVFAMAIKFLKNHCLEHLKETGCHMSARDILWVLTVPAIWKDVQKMFMREAAKEAGIIEGINDKNLMIALEPEAASVYCRSIYNSSLTSPSATPGGSSETILTRLVPQERFMVIDAGGGTIDITAYEVLPGGKCREVISPMGGAYGGKYVNENFQDLLVDLLKNPFMDYLKRKYPPLMLDLNIAFEIAKRQCNKELDEALRVQLGHIPFIFQEFMNTSLENHIMNNQIHPAIAMNMGKLKLPPEVLKKEIFGPIVQKVVDLVELTLQDKELDKLSTIFLVGGFSQCAYLEEQLKRRLLIIRPKVTFLKPEEPILCVLRGAVMCGADPKLIQSRIAPRTYLVGATNVDGCSFYRPVITKGDSVDHGHCEVIYSEPSDIGMQFVEMKLFAVEREGPYQMSDTDIIKVCQVKVKCMGFSPKDNLVAFYFVFGGPEIEITGIHESSKTKVKTTVDFLGP